MQGGNFLENIYGHNERAWANKMLKSNSKNINDFELL